VAIDEQFGMTGYQRIIGQPRLASANLYPLTIMHDYHACSRVDDVHTIFSSTAGTRR
jgi:hypothetical protein